jgi:hypothetical protein
MNTFILLYVGAGFYIVGRLHSYANALERDVEREKAARAKKQARVGQSYWDAKNAPSEGR